MPVWIVIEASAAYNEGYEIEASRVEHRDGCLFFMDSPGLDADVLLALSAATWKRCFRKGFGSKPYPERAD